MTKITLPKEGSKDLLVLSSVAGNMTVPTEYLRLKDAPTVKEQASPTKQAAVKLKVDDLMARYKGTHNEGKYKGLEEQTKARREAIEKELLALGRDALPALRDYAKLPTYGPNREAELASLAQSTISSLYNQPLPEVTLRELQDRSFDLNTAELRYGTDLSSPEARRGYESRIEKADALPANLDRDELEVRASHLEEEIKDLNLGGGFGTAAVAQKEAQLHAIGQVLRGSDRARREYVAALSQSSDPGDKQKATDILIRLTEADARVVFDDKLRPAILTACDNERFRASVLAYGKEESPEWGKNILTTFDRENNPSVDEVDAGGPKPPPKPPKVDLPPISNSTGAPPPPHPSQPQPLDDSVGAPPIIIRRPRQ